MLAQPSSARARQKNARVDSEERGKTHRLADRFKATTPANHHQPAATVFDRNNSAIDQHKKCIQLCGGGDGGAGKLVSLNDWLACCVRCLNIARNMWCNKMINALLPVSDRPPIVIGAAIRCRQLGAQRSALLIAESVYKHKRCLFPCSNNDDVRKAQRCVFCGVCCGLVRACAHACQDRRARPSR